MIRDFFLLSRGAAEDFSPRRKPSGKSQGPNQAPEGAKELRRGFLTPLPGLDYTSHFFPTANAVG